ncbi:MAG: P-loop NTPase [Candidatus Lindowbacteria bacterium]|nr:P-loop NTPase [Candidatus Lindowbacteria bacterium]
MDQAEELRRLIPKQKADFGGTRPERIIAIGSGKGGVGKSNIALNLGIELSMRGYSTYILDADFGLANVNILAGVTPKFTLSHLLQKGRSVEDLIIKGPGGLRIIPGASGNTRIANLNREERQILCRNLSDLKGHVDYLIMDVGAGISQNVISFLEKADEALVVVTPEPTSMADAYGLIKALSERSFGETISLVVNRAQNIKEAKMTADKMKYLAMQYLEQPVTWGGFLLEDSVIRRAVRQRKPFSAFNRPSIAARSVSLIADRIDNRPVIFETADIGATASWKMKRWFERVFH